MVDLKGATVTVAGVLASGAAGVAGVQATGAIVSTAGLVEGAALVSAVRTALSVRAARKEPPVRVRVDPQEFS